jgi:hypothetical protein
MKAVREQAVSRSILLGAVLALLVSACGSSSPQQQPDRSTTEATEGSADQGSGASDSESTSPVAEPTTAPPEEPAGPADESERRVYRDPGETLTPGGSSCNAKPKSRASRQRRSQPDSEAEEAGGRLDTESAAPTGTANARPAQRPWAEVEPAEEEPPADTTEPEPIPEEAAAPEPGRRLS